MNRNYFHVINFCKHANTVFILIVALYFLLIPGLTIISHLSDRNLQQRGIPRMAWNLFRDLTPRYERWARERVASQKAVALSTSNIAGTEWPLFGSVFYLWAVESLQEAWDENHALSPVEPREYARKAIEAATELVIDPNHAAWVKIHWGEDYLHQENVFYRMLLIAAMTSHSRLLGSTNHVPMLRDQVESLTKELDESTYGILNDYPFECYPTDVLMAVACIRRADLVLGTDHTSFAQRAIRGFQEGLLDRRGLPPYGADTISGEAFEPSRGCGLSYACIGAPALWPEVAKNWYTLYEKYFWQDKGGLSGFREFPNDLQGNDWYIDVDAGPVMGGIGISASAFGVAASRINGRFDHAYPLAAEMVTSSWPLPDGALLLPRLLSNAAHAPFLGEACILFNLTRQPAPGFEVRTGGGIPPIVYAALALYLGVGLLYSIATIRDLQRWRNRKTEPDFPMAGMQIGLWVLSVLTALVLLMSYGPTVSMLPLLFAQLLPRGLRPKQSCFVEGP